MDASSDKIALVTGASRGLGAALAEGLAARGFHIIALARTSGALEELDDRIRAAGSTATLAPMDVTKPEAMIQLAGAMAERWGGLDVWAHCAIHAAPLTPAGHIDPRDWQKSFDCNAHATHGLIALLHPLLMARKGTAIIPADDVAGHAYYASYGASKAAQMSLAQSWQAETQKLGPRVLTPTPAPMPTALRARFHPGEDRSRLSDCASEAARILEQAFAKAG
ncbi:MAG: SDR family NAD(P)-dependent oxidoreductase [Paracoccus sp. (in: a-proteobacteria)]|nr:SDR family NAD(P)-dependent oxidoreductase [Paracoccus sp. (in: a-proteobacteria)]